MAKKAALRVAAAERVVDVADVLTVVKSEAHVRTPLIAMPMA
jgi:hypothetical protein